MDPISLVISGIVSLTSSITGYFSKKEEVPVEMQSALNELARIKEQALAAQVELAKARIDLQKTALQSSNKLVADYQPIIAISMVVLVFLIAFNVVHSPPDTSPIWTVFEWIFGISIGGHTAHKGISAYADSQKGDDK